MLQLEFMHSISGSISGQAYSVGIRTVSMPWKIPCNRHTGEQKCKVFESGIRSPTGVGTASKDLKGSAQGINMHDTCQCLEAVSRTAHTVQCLIYVRLV